jgi:hypothetical protein
MDERRKVEHNEQVFYLRQSRSSLYVEILLMQFVFLGIGLIIHWLIRGVENVVNLNLNTPVNVIQVVILLIDMFFIYTSVKNWSETVYTICPVYQVVKFRFPKGIKKVFPLTMTERFMVEKGYFGKKLDYGTITIQSPFQEENLYLYNIPHPEHYLNLLTSPIANHITKPRNPTAQKRKRVIKQKRKRRPYPYYRIK